MHEFTQANAIANSLEEKNKANKISLSKLANEMKHWPDKNKIQLFQKYEMMNLKTYKCRNKNNISPIINMEFDPKKVVRDPEKLYEPRVQAYEAIKMHMDNVEQASAAWLHNRSVNAIENLQGE